jgi:cell division protein FtsQ
MWDLWHNAPALNRVSDLLFAAAALLVFYGAIRFAIVQPVFAIRELQVVGDAGRLKAEQVAALARRDIRGTFFTFDIVRLRNGFEKLPWVRKADVRRQWPNRIEVAIEAHQVLARWGKSALVNVQGEVFEAAHEGTLPLFSGPDGTSAEVTAQYEVFRRELAAVGRTPVQVSLSPRRAWQLRLDNGMTLEVGREQVPARLSRFLAAYPHTIAPLGRNADYVDLRYPNGFAVRVPELSKAKAAAQEQKPPAAARRRA